MNLFVAPKRSKIGIIPMPFANRIKKKKVRIIGDHVMPHLSPTFGFTMESRINCTTASSAFIQPLGT